MDVVWGRAEEQPTDRFGVALAKALAKPPAAAELCLPLVAGGWRRHPVGRRDRRAGRWSRGRAAPGRGAGGRSPTVCSFSGSSGRRHPAFRAAPGWRRSGLSPSSLPRLRIAQPHPAELDRRRDDAIPERPEARHDSELDPSRRVERRADRRARRPRAVRRALGSASSRRPRGRARTTLRAAGTRRLGCRIRSSQAASTACTRSRLRGGGRRRRPSSRGRPERAARTVARKPVHRQVPRVDRPYARLVALGGRADVRLEALDRRVLAHVPERMRPLADIRWRGARTGGDSSRPPLYACPVPAPGFRATGIPRSADPRSCAPQGSTQWRTRRAASARRRPPSTSAPASPRRESACCSSISIRRRTRRRGSACARTALRPTISWTARRSRRSPSRRRSRTSTSSWPRTTSPRPRSSSRPARAARAISRRRSEAHSTRTPSSSSTARRRSARSRSTRSPRPVARSFPSRPSTTRSRACRSCSGRSTSSRRG